MCILHALFILIYEYIYILSFSLSLPLVNLLIKISIFYIVLSQNNSVTDIVVCFNFTDLPYFLQSKSKSMFVAYCFFIPFEILHPKQVILNQKVILVTNNYIYILKRNNAQHLRLKQLGRLFCSGNSRE